MEWRFLRAGTSRVVAEDILTGRRTSFETDSIVVACGGRANDSLFHALHGQVAALFVIGDAVAPRRVHEAILEGTRIGRQI